MASLFAPPLDIDALFDVADADGDGVVGKADAQQFFRALRLPEATLGALLGQAFPPGRPMTQFHFIVALRLAALAQRGEEPQLQALTSQHPPYAAPAIACPFLLSSDREESLVDLYTQTADTPSKTVTSCASPADAQNTVSNGS